MMSFTYDIIMMQYWLAVLEKIAAGAIHSVSGYSTGIQYRMHVNTPIETLREQNFSSVTLSGYSIGIQDWYTVQDACERYLSVLFWLYSLLAV